jgi:hypothetical protein
MGDGTVASRSRGDTNVERMAVGSRRVQCHQLRLELPEPKDSKRFEVARQGGLGSSGCFVSHAPPLVQRAS